MPIRSIDYRQSKIKGPMHGLRPKSNNQAKNPSVDNSFVFSSEITDWYTAMDRTASAKFHGKAGKGMVRLDV
jgi:hypothetical protein